MCVKARLTLNPFFGNRWNFASCLVINSRKTYINFFWQNVLDDMLVETRSMIVDFGPKVTSGFETCVGYLRYLEITVFARPDLILVLVNIVNLVIAEAQVAEAEYSARSWRHLTSWQFKILCVSVNIL